MRYQDEGPQGFWGGLVFIAVGSLAVFVFSLIGSGAETVLQYIFDEPALCQNCEVEDVFMENLCIDCLNEKYDYDVYCVICEDALILNTPHHFKGYCDDCAKIDYSEYFCSECFAYTDNPESLVDNKCAQCNIS